MELNADDADLGKLTRIFPSAPNSYYKGIKVGYYFADLIVNQTVILELKACDYIIDEFEYQLINYLRSTTCEVGMLLNFGKEPEFIRKVFRNTNEKQLLKVNPR